MSSRSNKSVKPYTMVGRDIWRSKAFKMLPDDMARYLYLYFLTSPHQTSSGCMVMKEAYALGDLGLQGAAWTPEAYRRYKSVLVNAGLILVDDETDEILVTGWWNDRPPNNPDWFIGAEKQCDAISSPLLRKAAQDALGVHREAFEASRLSPARLALLNNRRG